MGKVVVIDPGHGEGYNKFKVGNVQYSEGTNMFRLGELLLQALIKRGVTAYRTRSLITQDPLLTTRGKFAGTHKADIFISLHSNGGVSEANGSEIFKSVKATKSTTALATELLRVTVGVLETKSRGVKIYPSSKDPKRDYYTVIDSAVQAGCNAAFILETAFHSNPTDARKLVSETYLIALSNALADVIAKHLGVNVEPKVMDIVVGSKVKITSGAVYGGASLGKKVPDTVLKKSYTVSKVQTNNNQKEALLKEITSWVPVKFLKVS